MRSGSKVHKWKTGFRAFHRAKMSSQDTQVNNVGCIFLPKNKLNTFKTLYLRRDARTCIFAVHVGTVLIVLIQSLRQKVHVIATLYLFPVLQNCEDLLIKQNIDLVSTEYPRPKKSTSLE